jgi:hypothetical protein
MGYGLKGWHSRRLGIVGRLIEGCQIPLGQQGLKTAFQLIALG